MAGKVKREPTERVSYRLPKSKALAVGELAEGLAWSEAKAAGFVIAAGLAALYGRPAEVQRLIEVEKAQRKVAAAQRDAKQLVAKARKATAAVLRPKKGATGTHPF